MADLWLKWYTRVKIWQALKCSSQTSLSCFTLISASFFCSKKKLSFLLGCLDHIINTEHPGTKQSYVAYLSTLHIIQMPLSIIWCYLVNSYQNDNQNTSGLNKSLYCDVRWWSFMQNMWQCSRGWESEAGEQWLWGCRGGHSWEDGWETQGRDHPKHQGMITIYFQFN